MAYDFDGATSYLELGSAPATTFPLTFACWVNVKSLASASNLLALGSSTANSSFALDVTSSGVPRARSNAAGTAVSASSSLTIATGTWYFICAVFKSATSREVTVNGGFKGTNATNNSPGSIDRFNIGARTESGSRNTFAAVKMAHAALWSGIIRDDDIAAMAAGLRPDQVNPVLGQLLYYNELDSADLSFNFGATQLGFGASGPIILTNNAAIPLADAPRHPFLPSSFFTIQEDSGTGTGVNAISIDEYFLDRIYQRPAGATSRTMTFTGTYTGTVPSMVQVKIDNGSGNIVAYTNLSSFTASGGAWSGTLSVPQGAWYVATAKNVDDGHTDVQANTWGIGILIALIGQSNMRNMWTFTSASLTPDTYVRYWGNDNTGPTNGTGWYATNKGIQGSGNGGDGINQLGVSLRAVMTGADPTSTVPVGFLAFAIGATSLESWITTANGGTNTSWATFTGSTGTGNANIGTEFEMAIWHQGEANAATGGSATAYATNLPLLLSQLQTLTGRDTSTFKLGVAIVGSIQTTGYSDSKMDTVRAAQLAFALGTSGVFFAGSSYDMFPDNGGLHWAPNAQYARMGRRYAQAIAKRLGLATYGPEGPSISSAVWPIGSSTITVTVSQGSGGTTLKDGTGSASGTGTVGFSGTFSGGQTISSWALSLGQILLTMSAVRGAAETASLEYGKGLNPLAFTGTADVDDDAIYDDQSSLIGDTTGLPLQQTSSAVTVTAPSSVVPVFMHHYRQQRAA